MPGRMGGPQKCMAGWNGIRKCGTGCWEWEFAWRVGFVDFGWLSDELRFLCTWFDRCWANPIFLTSVSSRLRARQRCWRALALRRLRRTLSSQLEAFDAVTIVLLRDGKGVDCDRG
jgi:hypothetical protein